MKNVLFTQLEKLKGILLENLEKTCRRIILWIEASQLQNSTGLPDLCPTDNATNVEPHINHLHHLLSFRGECVHNIAITSPYGGGKSSFIQTFIKRYPCFNYTCISLAAFAGNGTNTNDSDNINQIEKSIVQQILYRTKSEKVPRSRFRRIYPQPMSNIEAILVPLILLAWISAVFFAPYFDFYSIKDIFGKALTPSENVIETFLSIFLIGIPLIASIYLYVSFHRLNISRIKVFDGEMEFERSGKDSVFNVYLEEILYYFSSEKSNVVVFEDLDRFDKTNIFVKLKELNKLINDSNDVSQNVRFIYALKDDIFKGEERTKFFDAIIPIIPVTHSANSFAALKNLLRKSGFFDIPNKDPELDERFLRDISLYINDMRKLKNIVTEYGIYRDTLQLKPQDKTKLMAFIIYKNCYADDFASLHSGKGVFGSFVARANIIRSEKRARLENEIEELSNQLKNAKNEQLESIEELNTIYIKRFVTNASNEMSTEIYYINNQPFLNLAKPEIFDTLFNSGSLLSLLNPRKQALHKNYPLNHWAESDGFSYRNRKKNITNKYSETEKLVKEQIEEKRIEREITKHLPLSQLVVEYPDLLEKQDKTQKEDAGYYDLLKQLIVLNALDEQYHLYISIFEEGHITRDELNYIFSVQNNHEYDSKLNIINCETVTSYLNNPAYFKSRAFLNYSIVDYFISIEQIEQIKYAVRGSLVKADDRVNFFMESLDYIKHPKQWLALLVNEWPNIWKDLLTLESVLDEKKQEILVRCLEYLKDESNLLDSGKNELKKYISCHEEISLMLPTDETNISRYINLFSYVEVQFDRLTSCNNKAFVRQVLKHRMFKYTLENVKCILDHITDKTWSKRINYSELHSVNDGLFDSFLGKSRNFFAEWFSEDKIDVGIIDDVIDFLNDSEVDEKIKLSIIKNREFSIDEIDKIDNYWYQLIEHSRIKNTWDNICKALKSDDNDTKYIARKHLSNPKVILDLTSPSEASLSTDDFDLATDAILSDEVDTGAFMKYFENIGIDYPSSYFSKMETSKLRAIILSDDFEFDKEKYAALYAREKSLAWEFLEQKAVYFCENTSRISELNLSLEDIDFLLRSHKIDKLFKRIMLNHSSEKDNYLDCFSSNDKNVLDVFLPDYENQELYSASNYLPKISPSQLENLLPNIHGDEKKLLIIIGQFQNLDTETALKLCSLVPGYEKLGEEDRVSLTYKKINRYLESALKFHKFIFSSSRRSKKSKDGIILNIREN